MWAGLLISYHFDLAAGASVVVVAVALFFVVFTIQAVRESLAQRRTGSVAPVG